MSRKSPEWVGPFEYNTEREPDEQYTNLLRLIRSTGRTAISGMDDPSREILGHTMRFDLSNGFPVITERDLTVAANDENIENYKSNPELRPITSNLRQALGEIIAFINGARTQEELESYGCTVFWKPWTVGEEAERKAKKRGLEVGDLGPGSYGAAFHDFPTAEGAPFNQYEALIQQIKDRPELRTHYITPFIPQYTTRAPGHEQKVMIVPCHGLQHFNVDTERGEISLVQWQRSADVPVGLPFNMVHYAALLMMVGQVTGYKPKEVVMMLSNAHIYGPEEKAVEELLKRPTYPFPKLVIDPDVKRLEDFRVEHFQIAEYNANSPMKMGELSV